MLKSVCLMGGWEMKVPALRRMTTRSRRGERGLKRPKTKG